ncbi:hypothetical protein RP20_CCG019194 [Aedes albopictus]|nr:hypothetical protein RP20_CCG019194 [Aedes albopictus]
MTRSSGADQNFRSCRKQTGGSALVIQSGKGVGGILFPAKDDAAFRKPDHRGVAPAGISISAAKKRVVVLPEYRAEAEQAGIFIPRADGAALCPLKC